MTYEELSSKDRDELRQIAEDQGVFDALKYGKEDLIHHILEKGAEDGSQR